MQSTWYRLPDEDTTQNIGKMQRGGKARGRGRGRGRSRGRGNARQSQEPRGASHDAATPYHIYGLGHHPLMQQPAYAPHPYYYNPANMEERSPYWQYVANQALHPTHRHLNQTSNSARLGYQQFPTRPVTPAGHPPHGYYEMAGRREHLQQFINMGPMHPTHPEHAIQDFFPQPSRFHQLPFSNPTYGRYAKHKPTPNKTQQQPIDKHTSQKSHKPQCSRASAIQTQVSQELANSITSMSVRPKPPEVQEYADMHIKPTVHPPHTQQILEPSEFLNNPNMAAVQPHSHKTLAETAAFLNHPQLVLQQAKDLNLTKPIHPTHNNCMTLPHTPIFQNRVDINTVITLDPLQTPQAQAAETLSHQNNCATNTCHLLLSHEEGQVLRSKDSNYARYDNSATSSEFNVTLDIEPRPAHQATIAQTIKFPKHPGLYTPPLAHQTPTSQIPSHPQSARVHETSSQSPPPAHQASTTHTLHYMHSKSLNALQTIDLPTTKVPDIDKCVSPTKPETNARSNRRQNKRKSNTSAKADSLLGTTRVIYGPHQMLGETQIVYQPSTETFSSEQVLYQPRIDMFTKEQIVYQPRKKMLAKTQVVYQPRMDYIATAEAVYQSDTVAARQTVIQPQATKIKTAGAAYNTQYDMISRQRRHNSQADALRTAEALYQQQVNLAPKHTNNHSQPEVIKTTESAHQNHKNILAENQTTLQLLAEVQAHIQYASSTVTGVDTEMATPILRNILSNEEQQGESQEPEGNIATLQQFLHQNYNTVLQHPSISVTPNQSLRQTRKRKIASTQPDGEVQFKQHSAMQQTHELMSLGSASSSRTQSVATEIQSIIALNWKLQSLATSWQVMPYFYDFIENLITNDVNTRNAPQSYNN